MNGLLVQVGAALLIAAATLSGCSGPSSQAVGTTPSPAHLAGKSSAPRPSESPVAPEIVAWGGTGNHLAIVVRNMTTKTVMSASVVVRAFDHNGRPIAVASPPPDSKCCSLFEVAPRAVYGVYATLRGDVRNVGRITVTYVGAVVLKSGSPPSQIAVGTPSLQRTANDAVVSALVATTATDSPYLIGQAVLVDSRGRIADLISGRFYCFYPGTIRQLHMQLMRPVPAGTHIGRVIFASIPPSQVPIHGIPRCAP